jgi:hypothetical protein
MHFGLNLAWLLDSRESVGALRRGSHQAVHHFGNQGSRLDFSAARSANSCIRRQPPASLLRGPGQGRRCHPHPDWRMGPRSGNRDSTSQAKSWQGMARANCDIVIDGPVELCWSGVLLPCLQRPRSCRAMQRSCHLPVRSRTDGSAPTSSHALEIDWSKGQFAATRYPRGTTAEARAGARRQALCSERSVSREPSEGFHSRSCGASSSSQTQICELDNAHPDLVAQHAQEKSARRGHRGVCETARAQIC